MENIKIISKTKTAVEEINHAKIKFIKNLRNKIL